MSFFSTGSVWRAYGWIASSVRPAFPGKGPGGEKQQRFPREPSRPPHVTSLLLPAKGIRTRRPCKPARSPRRGARDEQLRRAVVLCSRPLVDSPRRPRRHLAVASANRWTPRWSIRRRSAPVVPASSGDHPRVCYTEKGGPCADGYQAVFDRTSSTPSPYAARSLRLCPVPTSMSRATT